MTTETQHRMDPQPGTGTDGRTGRGPNVKLWIFVILGVVVLVGAVTALIAGLGLRTPATSAPPASDRTIDVTITADHPDRALAESVAVLLPSRAASAGATPIERADVVDDRTVRLSFADPVTDDVLDAAPWILETGISAHEVRSSTAYDGGECTVNPGGDDPSLHDTVCDLTAGELLVLAPAEFDGSAIAEVHLRESPNDPATSVVDVTFTEDGTARLAALTSGLADTGSRIAFISGGQIVTAPAVLSPLTDGVVQISGPTATALEPVAAAFRLGMANATLTAGR